MQNKKKYLSILLISIFLLGFSVRYKDGIFISPDSYFWHRVALYFSGVDHGFIEREGNKLIDTLAYYPFGRDLNSELIFLPKFVGYTFKFFSFFGLKKSPDMLFIYMKFLSPFLGAISSIFLFLLLSKIIDEKSALISAALYSTLAPAIVFSNSYFFVKETLAIPLSFLWIYLLLSSVKKGDFIFSFLSALILFFAAYTWGGAKIFIFIISVSAIIYFIFGENIRNFSKPFILTFSLGILFSYIFAPEAKIFGFNFFDFIIYISIIFGFLASFAEKRKVRIYILFVSIIIIFLFFHENIFDIIFSVLSGKKYGLGAETIGYYRASNFDDLLSLYGIFLIFLPFGFLFLLNDFYKNRDIGRLFLVFLTIFAFAGFRYMIRLSVILAPVIVILNSLAITKIGKKIKEVYLLLIIIFILSTMISVNYIDSMKSREKRIVSLISVGEWIKNNTPENSLLVHWWDYGYYLQSFAERKTIVDHGNTGKPVMGGSKNRNIDIAKAFLSNEEDFYKYIAPYNKENLSIYVIVSFDDLKKSGSIAGYAGKSIGASEYKDLTLFKLLIDRKSLNKFRLEYSYDNIFVYKYLIP